MAYWVKIISERKEYVINLDHVNVFCCEKNGRVTFWLPNTTMAIVINPHHHPEDYQVIEYLERLEGLESRDTHWVKITYEGKEYVINLTSISSFCCESNGRITFWLPNVTIPIIINPVNNQESYEKVLQYIQQATGHSFYSNSNRPISAASGEG